MQSGKWNANLQFGTKRINLSCFSRQCMRTNVNNSERCGCGGIKGHYPYKSKQAAAKCEPRFALRRSDANFDGTMEYVGDDNQTTSRTNGTRHNDGGSQSDDTLMGPQDGAGSGSDTRSEGDTFNESFDSKNEGDDDDPSGSEGEGDSEECEDFCDDEKYW